MERGSFSFGFADGGKKLLLQKDETISSWDVATGKELKAWKPIEDKHRPAGATMRYITAVSFPDGRYLAAQTAMAEVRFSPKPNSPWPTSTKATKSGASNEMAAA